MQRTDRYTLLIVGAAVGLLKLDSSFATDGHVRKIAPTHAKIGHP